MGLVKFQDSESGQEQWVDTSLKSIRLNYSENWNRKQKALQNSFARAGVDYTSVSTSEDYVKPLITLFKKR